MIGQKLGPYKIMEEVGQGGMATVYRAHQPSIERDVAVKLIRGHRARSPEAIQRFQREARLIARLEHSHILPVYDFDGSHEPPYIVMRYLERAHSLLQERAVKISDEAMRRSFLENVVAHRELVEEWAKCRPEV